MKTSLENSDKVQRNSIPLLAVIFDVDGTLADNEQDGHRVAFNRAFETFGLDWHWSPEVYGELLAAVAGGRERLRYYAQSHLADIPDGVESETWISRLHQRKTAIYSEISETGAITLRPGIARLLQELRAAKIRLAIATTSNPSSVHSLISAHFPNETASMFEVIGAGDQVELKKPAPDIYQWVLQQMGLPPENCLAIEDSSIGLRAARSAGLPTIISVSAYTNDDDFSGALSVVSDLGEPDAPSRSISGLPLKSACVDLHQLRAWHEEFSLRTIR